IELAKSGMADFDRCLGDAAAATCNLLMIDFLAEESAELTMHGENVTHDFVGHVGEFILGQPSNLRMHSHRHHHSPVTRICSSALPYSCPQFSCLSSFGHSPCQRHGLRLVPRPRFGG